MTQLDPNDPKFLMFCQLVAAFGQGAGTMNVTREAVSAITDTYWPVIASQTNLDNGLLQALEYARGLGRVAAARALADGYNLVRPQDFQAAAEALQRHRVALLQDCPYC
jgi:hypothetical protein